MIEGIISNTILGGVTGYITNNMAIKMLFRSYFGFGGVIEKEYESFIKNISELIERDLINHDTLLSEIKSDEFKKMLDALVRDLFENRLPYVNGEKALCEINGFKESKQNIISYLEEKENEFKKEFLKNVDTKKLLSKEQFYYIQDNVNEVLENKNFGDTLYFALEDKKLDEILSNKIFSNIKKNLTFLLREIDFRDFDGDIEEFLNEILNIIDIDEIIKSAEKSIANMYFSDFINDTDNLSKEIIKRLIAFVNTKKGEELLKVLIQNIISSLKRVDVRVYDVINEKTAAKVDYFIKNTLPYILDDIIRFVDKNQRDIERRIDSAINRVLDRSISGKILKKLKDIFMEDLVSRYGVVEEIKRAIRDYGDEAGAYLADKFHKMLKNHTIGEIIEILEEKGILKESILIALIKKNLNNLKDKNLEFLDELLNKRVGDVVDVDLSVLKDFPFVEYVKNFVYSDRFKNSLIKSLNELIEDLREKRVRDLSDGFDFGLKLDFDYEKVKFSLEDIDFKIDYSFFDKTDYITFNNIYSKFQNEKTYKNLESFTLGAVESNLKNMLEGKVSKAVSNELMKFSPAEIRDMVENFMGKELKPINTLGAILGSVAGAGYYAATFSFSNPLLTYATPLIYGVTGIFTNHLAITMLFRPYEKKSYLPYFSPGVVAKQKPKFAQNISNFVRDDILNDEALVSIFQKNEKVLKEALKGMISKDNYFVFDKLLENIAPKVYEFLTEYLIENKEKVATYLADYFYENRYLLQDYSSDIAKFLLEEIKSKDFSNFVIKKLQETNLSEFIPFILEFISKNSYVLVDKIIEALEFDKVKRKLLEYEKEFNEFVNTKSLQDFITYEMKKKIISSTKDKIFETIKDKNLIDLIVDKIQQESLTPNKKLRYVFDGFLERALYENVDNLVEVMIEAADDKRYDIKEKLIDALPFGTGWALKGKVEDIVDEVFDYTLPEFLNEKKMELLRILSKVLDYNLYDMGIDEDILNKEKLKEIFYKMYESEGFKRGVESFIISFISVIFMMKVIDILRLLNIRSVRDLVNIFEGNIRDILDIVVKNIQTKEKELIETVNLFLQNVLEEILKDKSLLDLLELKKEDVSKIVKNILENEKFQKELLIFLEDVLFELFSRDFFDKDILKRDLEEFLVELKYEKFQKVILPFVEEFFKNLNLLLDDRLKEEITDELIEALFLTLKDNLDLVIKAIDIKEVIKREINQMHPKEIEEMFYSFAGSYFNKLKLYGGIGAVFGLPSLVL